MPRRCIPPRSKPSRASGWTVRRASPANSSCCGNRASPDPAPPRLRLNTLCDRRRRALIQQGGPHRSRPFGKNSVRAWIADAPDGWRSRNCALSTIGRCRTSGSPAAISSTLRGMEIVANDAVAVAGLGPATTSGDGVCVRAGDAGHRARRLAAALDLRGVAAAVAGGRRGRASRGFRRVRRRGVGRPGTDHTYSRRRRPPTRSSSSSASVCSATRVCPVTESSHAPPVMISVQMVPARAGGPLPMTGRKLLSTPSRSSMRHSIFD